MIFSPLLSLTVLLSGLAATTSAAAYNHPTVYVIRHGEKSGDPMDKGLNQEGFERAECLRTVFAAESQYDIGYIIAPMVPPDGSHRRSFETVTPLARDLDLTVDTSCWNDDTSCVRDLVRNYHGPGNILIAWRHSRIKKIVKKLGNKKAPKYPDVYDIIWTIPWPYTSITDNQSEQCPGLDFEEELDFQEGLVVQS